MQSLINTIVAYCVKSGYISEQYSPWLKYGLEKRISGLFVAIPFLLLGFYISDIVTSITYFIGFRFLRKRTNGLHAKTVLGCLFASVLCEFIFLGLILPVLNPASSCLLLVIASIIICILAPYKNSNIDLSQEEIIACAKSSKIRLCMLLFACLISRSLGFYCISKGIVLSIITTSTMLVLANILTKGG